MKQKKIQDRLNRLYAKAQNHKRQCSSSDCRNNAINSHILQKNGILNGIATNGHVIISKTDFLNEDLFYFKKVGINTAFTFKGFCSTHDNSIFKPIEGSEIDFEDYKSQLLFAYRTILNEKHKKKVLITWNNLQINDSEISQVVDKTLLKATNVQNEIAITDLKYYENIIVSNLQSKKEDFVFKVRYIKEFDICLASHFTFETTRERQAYIKKTGKDYELLTDIFVSLFPIEGETVFMMGYLKSMEDKCGEFVKNFFEIEEPDLLHEMNKLLLMRCEEWVCSEKFYNEHIEEREDKINAIFQDAATTLNEDKEVELNIFD